MFSHHISRFSLHGERKAPKERHPVGETHGFSPWVSPSSLFGAGSHGEPKCAVFVRDTKCAATESERPPSRSVPNLRLHRSRADMRGSATEEQIPREKAAPA